MIIIDSHTHAFGNKNSRLAGHVKKRRDAVLFSKKNPELFHEHWKHIEDLTELLLEDMDANGIGKAALMPAVGETPELVASAVKRHPDRFFGLFMPGYGDFYPACEPDRAPYAPDLNKFADNVKHWVRDLGLRGLGEFAVRTFSRESAPDRIAKDLMPVMEIIDEFKIPVMVPTAWTQYATPLYHGLPLFVDDLAERFREIPFILTKMGRGYSYIFEMCLGLATKHDNVFLDTVHAPSSHVTRAVREVGADRIMFGTDWDWTWRELELPEGLYKRGISVIEQSEISDDDKEWILGKTCAEVFKVT